MSEYEKLVLNIDEQIELLESRKLNFDDHDKAKKYLNHIGYYRLSQYFKANQYFRKIGGKIIYKNIFRDGTYFKDIIDLYKFDRELRILVMDMIERIEISVRSTIINELSLNKKNPFCYLDYENFQNVKSAETVRNLIFKNISSKKYKKHEIGKHFDSKYTSSFFPPIWMILNTSEFGVVTTIYKNLKHDIREKISSQYTITESDFGQTIDIIRQVRNIVSHHERLFNLSFSYGKSSSIKFYTFIKKINNFKNHIVPTSGWNKKVQKLYEKYKHLEPVKSNFYY